MNYKLTVTPKTNKTLFKDIKLMQWFTSDGQRYIKVPMSQTRCQNRHLFNTFSEKGYWRLFDDNNVVNEKSGQLSKRCDKLNIGDCFVFSKSCKNIFKVISTDIGKNTLQILNMKTFELETRFYNLDIGGWYAYMVDVKVENNE